MKAATVTTTIHARDSLIAHTILIGSLCCSLVLIAIMVFYQQHRSWMTVLLGFLFPVIILWYSRGYILKRPRWANWMLSLAVINLVAVVPEVALRVIDFGYAPGIRGDGYRRGIWEGRVIRLIPDEKLFWKVSPEDVKVNSLGFPYKEVSVPKPPRTYRILYFGDSCTQQGYPLLTEFFLNSDNPKSEKQFESVNLALSGYSSHQGRVLAEQHGVKLDPDLVVIYFGWNDHWIAQGATDANKVIHVPSTRWEKTIDLLHQKSRVLQGIKKVAVTLSGSRIDELLSEVQVPPAQYRANLLAIMGVFDRRRTPVIFITAPTAHYRLGVPDYVLQNQMAFSKQRAIAMHRQYNQIVRDLARENGAYVLDLESEFNELLTIKQVFLDDGIHFANEGLSLVARRLTDFIEREVLPRYPVR